MITIKNYTKEELEYIKNNYNSLTVKQIATNLNKTYNSISNAIRKLGLKKQKHKKWTEEENDFLKINYMNMTNDEIAKKLNRTFDSISAQMDRLNLVRAKPWTDIDEKYLIENFKIMTHKEIGKALGRTEQAIRAKCFDLNLYKKEVSWEDWELEFLKNNYMEMSNAEISKMLNRTENAIHLQASRLGFKKYPYMCDYHYFDDIDTEEKAYWLGFLTADGWINKNDKNNAGVTGIELQYGDINHLKKFNKSIGGNYQITDRWRECSISTKDKEKKHHLCCIRVFSLTMYNSLAKKGFSNNKSYDFHIPNLPEDLVKHYIRGYFDGDGCLCATNKSFRVTFTTASENLKKDLKSILSTNGFKMNEFSYINEFNTKMYTLSIDRYDDKIKFLDWIYKDSNIYLDRKYKKYLKVKKRYEDTQSLAA